MNSLITFFGSFFYTGFFPVAPATFASFVFAALYLIPGGEVIAGPVALVCTLVASIPIATRMELKYGNDSGHIVIDEVVGMQIVLVAASPTVAGVALGFFLFRVFDIIKPFPIRKSQDIPRGYGVVCDDVLAGIYVRVAMIILSSFFPWIGTFA
ncbi:MAG: phosphatidylglycerophosphatase A [Candidatus Latescibacterota bacterium]